MNFDWAQRWLGSFGNLDQMMEMYADNVQFEDIIFGEKARSKAELRHFFDAFSAPTAGHHSFRADSYTGSSQGGAVEWTWFADHAGDFLGVSAAGKHTETRGVSVLTFENGLVVAQHDLWDAAAVYRQLGVVG